MIPTRKRKFRSSDPLKRIKANLSAAWIRVIHTHAAPRLGRWLYLAVRTFLPAIGIIAKGIIEFDAKFGAKARANLTGGQLTAYNILVTTAGLLLPLLDTYTP